MRLCVLLFVLQLYTVGIAIQTSFLDSPVNIMLLRAFRNWTFDFFGRTGDERGRNFRAAKNLNKIQDRVPDSVPFPCDVSYGRSAQVPNSVHRLRPGDIDVIGAIGDSLTAGAGVFATSLPQVIIENRGVSASSGGQGTWREYLTLPNIFKVFNPKLTGYALGDSLTSHKDSRLNVAEVGAMSQDTPYMAEVLIKRIKHDPAINFERDWKYISVMIGPNDFCSEMCWIPSPWTILKDHRTDLIETLRKLRDNLPRTFVSLIPPPNLKVLVDTRRGRPSLKCDITTDFECSCLFGLRFRRFRPIYYDIMNRWQELEEEIAQYPEFHTEDFTVVVQPVLTNITFPVAEDGYSDFTFLSADCFHISQKLNAVFANVMWNSLLTPIGRKPRDWGKLFAEFLCPTPQDPYIKTQLNSQEANRFAQ